MRRMTNIMEEQIIKRILPHSAEAEQSVIGAILLDSEAIITASEILLPEDFYNPQKPNRKKVTGLSRPEEAKKFKKNQTQ